eukprot:g2010.t1
MGLVVTAAATLATLAISVGSPNTSEPVSMVINSAVHVGHQSLFASPKSRGGISIVQPSKTRVLQEDSDDVVTTPIVQYETKLQLFMCNPSLVEEGNDPYLVDETRLASALSKIDGLRQADPDKVTVATKTAPTDVEDSTYLCDTHGKLQWHAQITYTEADATARDTTPAVMAAQATDYVSYSATEFKTLLIENINTEYGGGPETVELSAADIVVPNVGWLVTFPAEETVAQETNTARSSDGLAMGLGSDHGLWVWWVWLIYALLVACCLVPLCCLLRRRREDVKNATSEQLDATRIGRGDEGLAKIRGPEWGITELDFEGDHHAYQNQEMKREYDGAGRGLEPMAYKPSSHRAGQQSISAQAWMQEAGKKSAWRPQPSGSSRQIGQDPVVRRFDIDDDDNHDGIGQLRSRHPQYSFDVGRGGFNGESKS